MSLVEPGHVKVLYNYAPFSSFENNNCMNFTVNFKTKKLGEVSTNAVINWTQGDNYQVNASGSTVVGLDTDFKLEYTPSALIVNVNEIVAYDVVVTNLGGNYSGWVGIDIVYNAEELEYINFTPNFNPENYDTYSAAGTPNPIDKGDGVNGHLYFGYMNAPCIENGHVFNFTINFKPLKECEESVKFVTNASIDWWQIEHHSVKDSAYVFVTDADFVLDIVPSTTDLLKIGDSVSFDVVAHNLDGSFYGSYIGFDLFFDPDELEYKSFNINDQPDGLFKLEYGGVTGQSIGNGLLGAVSLTTDEGHLHFGFTPSESLKASMADGTNTDCSFNFTINYNVKDNGLLMNNAELAWGEGEDQKVLAAAAVSAGEESFILTKTPEQDKVTVGDDVYFTFYLENTGADIYGYRTIYAEDWYPGGELEYVDAVVNSNSTPVNIVPVSGQYHLYIYQNTTNNYWRNGDYFNVTLHFIVKEPGVHCNHAFFRGNSTTGTVFTDEPNMNLTKTTREEVVNEGQYVYFDILLENLEDSIPYYDHVHETTDVVLTDVYPDSIEYVSCTLNKDTQGNGKLNVVDNGNNLTIRYTPEGSRWFQGNSINITLMFKAVKPGSFKNEVDFFWKWKDVGSEENVTLTSESPFIIGTPDFALEKISNFETAKVGDIVSFTIIYTNNGTLPLTGVYIVDNDYSDGLVYSDYSDKDSWTFDGKDKWTYNEDLQPGDAATLVLYFEATSTGEKNNTAIAGNNEMDETKNSTDIVLIKDKELDSAEDADEPDGSEEDDETDDVPDSNPEEPDEPVEEETVEEPTPSVAKTASLPAAGNPLVILLMSLLTLCFVPIRGKK